MLINKSNYEEYALDYLEGNLSASQGREMELFLAAQPAIAAEVDAMREFVSLEADMNIVFEPKHLLIKEEKAAIVFWMQPLFRQRVAAAAVALLLLSTGYFMGKKNDQLNNEMPIANNTNTEQIFSPENKQLEEDCLDSHLAVVSEEETDNSKRTNNSTNTQTKTNERNTSVKSQQQQPATAIHFDLAATKNTTVDTKEELKTADVLKEDLITEKFTEVVAALNPLPSTNIRTVKSEITTIDYVYINDVVVNFETNKTGKRLRNLLGTLPFEDIKLANFVPTYYSDEVGE